MMGPVVKLTTSTLPWLVTCDGGGNSCVDMLSTIVLCRAKELQLLLATYNVRW